MYPLTHHPSPLATQAFYVLLALSDSELHAYAIKTAITHDSLGGVKISDGQLSNLLTRLHNEGLIDMTGLKPTPRTSRLRMHYGISGEGLIRLQEELSRWQHAVNLGSRSGLMGNPTPTDIQRIILQTKS